MTLDELSTALVERREATKAARNEARIYNKRVSEAERLEKEAFQAWVAAFEAAHPYKP